MAIVSSDIVKRYSVVTASAGDTQAGTAAGALGDQVSTTVITDNVFGNLFPDITSEEATAGVIKYRCIFVLNNHGSLTLTAPDVSVQSQQAGGATIAIGVDPTAVSAKGASGAQAVTIANENTAPAGVTFGTSAVALGDLAPGQVKGVWIRQTTTAGASALASDDFVLLIDGDTLP